MDDLNTISKRNAEAFADAVQNYRKQGRWVMAVYSGLALMSIETFSSEEDAMRSFGEFQPGDPSNTVKLLYPTNVGMVVSISKGTNHDSEGGTPD